MQPLGVGAGANTIVQGLIGNLFSIQLALGVFMPVQAQLGIVGKVGTELQEKGAEVLVHAVEVIIIDQGGGFDDPRIAGVLLRVVPFLSAIDGALLLRFADEDHAFALCEFGALFGGDLSLRCPFSKLIKGIC